MAGLRSRSSTTPSDQGQLAQLLGKSYAYIPIALSGTTESFLAGETNQGQPFPVSTFNLTPNMVSGLITSLYQSPLGQLHLPAQGPLHTVGQPGGGPDGDRHHVRDASGLPVHQGQEQAVPVHAEVRRIRHAQRGAGRLRHPADVRFVQLQRGERIELRSDQLAVRDAEHTVHRAGGRGRSHLAGQCDGDRHQRRLRPP